MPLVSIVKPKSGNDSGTSENSEGTAGMNFNTTPGLPPRQNSGVQGQVGATSVQNPGQFIITPIGSTSENRAVSAESIPGLVFQQVGAGNAGTGNPIFQQMTVGNILSQQIGTGHVNQQQISGQLQQIGLTHQECIGNTGLQNIGSMGLQQIGTSNVGLLQTQVRNTGSPLQNQLNTPGFQSSNGKGSIKIVPLGPVQSGQGWQTVHGRNMTGGNIQLQPLTVPVGAVNVTQANITQPPPLSIGTPQTVSGRTGPIGVNLLAGNQLYMQKPFQTFVAQPSTNRTPSPSGTVPTITHVNRPRTNHMNVADTVLSTSHSRDANFQARTLSNSASPTNVNTANKQPPIYNVQPTSDGKNLFLFPPTFDVAGAQCVAPNVAMQSDSIIPVSDAALNRQTAQIVTTAPNTNKIGAVGPISDGKVFNHVPSDGGHSVLQSLLEQCEPTSVHGTIHKSSDQLTAGSSLCGNPFISGQTSATLQKGNVKKSSIDGSGASISNAQLCDDSGFELKFEDGGYTILMPQTENPGGENQNNTKNTTSDGDILKPTNQKETSEVNSFSLFDDEGDLQIDLDRLDELTNELSQFNNSSQNVGPSKELELIQKEQKNDQKPTSSGSGQTSEAVKSDEFENIMKSLEELNKMSEPEKQETRESGEVKQGDIGKDRNREMEIIAEQNQPSPNSKGWSQVLTLLSIEETKEQIQSLSRQGREEDVNVEIPKIEYSRDTAKCILARLLLSRIRNHLNASPGFQTEKLNSMNDLFSRSEILAVKDITKIIRQIVEDFEVEMSTWGLKYGDGIYLETLSLTVLFKTFVIPKLGTIQKEERGLENQVLLVMIRESLQSLNPQYADKLCDTRESLHSLMSEPGVALAVESTLTEFEQKYLNTVFNDESRRTAACTLMYRIRKMLACHLYWFEPLGADEKNFQLLYSLRKLIFFQISQYLEKVFPNSKSTSRDIYSLRKLCSERADIQKALAYCVTTYSRNKGGLIFQTLRDVLHCIEKHSIETNEEAADNFQMYQQGLYPGYPVFVKTMNNLLESINVPRGKDKLFDAKDIQPPVSDKITPHSSQMIRGNVNQLVVQKAPGAGHMRQIAPVWTAAFEVTASRSKRQAMVEKPQVDRSGPAAEQKKTHIGILLDESNLTYYKTTAKEMKRDLARSKPDVRNLICENKILMFSGLLESFLRKPTGWISSGSESSDEEEENTGCNAVDGSNITSTLSATAYPPYESNQIGSVRIKDEPEDCGLYGINTVASVTKPSEIIHKIKTEPGLEQTIKQEKDTDWSTSSVTGTIKTEPVDPETTGHLENEPCHQCPLHLGGNESLEEAPPEVPPTLSAHYHTAPYSGNEHVPELSNAQDTKINCKTDSANDVDDRNDDGKCTEPVAGSTITSVQQQSDMDAQSESQALSPSQSGKVADACLNDGINSSSTVLHNHPEEIYEKEEKCAKREDRVVEKSATQIEGERGNDTNSPNLEDILLNTVDTVFSEIHTTQQNPSKATEIDICAQLDDAQCQNVIEESTEETIPLRHSVEGTRQEALEFLKQLNSLQSTQSTENPSLQASEICKKDLNTGNNSLIVKTAKIRPSVELDMILSETVDRVYSEINSETSSMTGTMNMEELEIGTKETEKDDVNKENCVENHNVTMIKDETPEPESPNYLEAAAGACGVHPIVIEPEHYDGDNIAMDKTHDAPTLAQVGEDKIVTKTDVASEFIAESTQLMLINIEPVESETRQEMNEVAPEKPKESETTCHETNLKSGNTPGTMPNELAPENPKESETTCHAANQKSENTSGTMPNEDDQKPLKTEEEEIIADASSAQCIKGMDNLGSLTIEADNEQAALNNLLKKEAREKRRKQKLEKKMEKIQELQKYYEEQLQIIQNAKLTENSDQKEIQEQLQCLKENHELAEELGLDSRELFGCYACGYTGSSQEEVMTHWMETHIEDSLYVCPYCCLDLPTSQLVVAHILEWHPKLPVRVIMKASEIYQDRIELEFMLSKKAPGDDQCFVVKGRNECYSVDTRDDGGRRYECRKCEYFCMEKDLIELHVKLAHTAGTRFKCDICELYYSSYRSVEVHVLRDHYGKDPSTHRSVSETISSQAIVPIDKRNWEKINLVTTNNLQYSARFSRTSHQTVSLKASDYWDVCTVDFDNIFLLCKMCKFSPKEENLMWSHVVNMHESPKEVSCPKCYTLIEVAASERRNCLTVCRECRILLTLNIEQGKELLCIEDLYVCTSCSFRTKELGEMEQHAMQIHFRLKPYKCKYCSMCNAVKHIVKRHIAEIHPTQPSKVITDQKQIERMNSELGCSYKSYQVIRYKDEVNTFQSIGTDVFAQKKTKSLRDSTNIDSEREFSEGEDLNTILAACALKQTRAPTPTHDAARFPNELDRPMTNDDTDRNYSGFDHYECLLCKFKTHVWTNMLRHVKRHLKLEPYKCYYCKFQHLERHVVTKHLQAVHAGQESLVYTNEATLRALNDEARKNILKIKGSGERSQMPKTKGEPSSLLKACLDGKVDMTKFTRTTKPNKNRQKKRTSNVDAEQMLKLLVDKLPSKKKPQDGPSWEQKSTDEDESLWTLNQDLDSGPEEGRKRSAKNSRNSAQSQKRKKPSQRKRQRLEVDEAGDSDESWSMGDRSTRRRNKRQVPRKRIRYSDRARPSDDDSDWLQEFLSDTDSDTQMRKKAKTVQYQLCDEDFRSNYAFLLNDDKLLEDPIVKLVALEIDGPSVILKNESKRSVEVKAEPQEFLVEEHRLLAEEPDKMLGVVVKTEPADDFVLPLPQEVIPSSAEVGTMRHEEGEIQKQNTPMNLQPGHTHSTSADGEKTTVEIFSGGERTVLQAIVEFTGDPDAPVSGLVAPLVIPEVENIVQTTEKQQTLISHEIKIKEEPVEPNSLEKEMENVGQNPTAATNDIKEEPFIKSEPTVPEFQPERRSRRRARQVTQSVVKLTPEKSGRNTSRRRHKWTDQELRIYHSHVNSDPVLTKNPVVLIERLNT